MCTNSSFGTRVPGRYIAVGRSSGVAVKRGSTVVVLHRPGNQIQLPSTLDWGTTVPIATRVMFTHKFVIMYTCICAV